MSSNKKFVNLLFHDGIPSVNAQIIKHFFLLIKTKLICKTNKATWQVLESVPIKR